jgi:ubiquinone/menaquinone biosynthesis C-methylase UbiE
MVYKRRARKNRDAGKCERVGHKSFGTFRMKYYNSIAKGYDNLHKEEQLKKLRIIKNNLEIKKSDKLLDVGCGTGFSLDYFDCETTGIDPSKELIKQYSGKSRMLLGKAEKLPFKDKSFDIVISITAIHNFKNIEKGLKEIQRDGKERFAFSILKKSKITKNLIKKYYKIKKTIEEEKDIIYII